MNGEIRLDNNADRVTTYDVLQYVPGRDHMTRVIQVKATNVGHQVDILTPRLHLSKKRQILQKPMVTLRFFFTPILLQHIGPFQ